MLLEEFYDSWIARFANFQQIFFSLQPKEAMIFFNLFFAIIEKNCIDMNLLILLRNNGNSKVLFVFLDSMIDIRQILVSRTIDLTMICLFYFENLSFTTVSSSPYIVWKSYKLHDQTRNSIILVNLRCYWTQTKS